MAPSLELERRGGGGDLGNAHETVDESSAPYIALIDFGYDDVSNGRFELKIKCRMKRNGTHR